MNVNTSFTPAPKVAPVIFEQIWGEKPKGGRIAAPTFDILQGTAVYQEGDMFKPIKAYRLVSAVAQADTTIKIAKNSGVAVGDFIGHGKKAVACTAIDTTNEAYDLVTVTMGEAIDNDVVLFQAKAASADAAIPCAIPMYVVGNDVPGNKGDYAVRLVNGANLRKETAPIAPEVVALMSNINLV